MTRASNISLPLLGFSQWRQSLSISLSSSSSSFGDCISMLGDIQSTTRLQLSFELSNQMILSVLRIQLTLYAILLREHRQQQQ